ncbi:hypothetical protein, partial [Ralstonia solanacearum]|uniref:hypothetical protein n=1 Tax=Ralstonia solanacearum TaxID=305 RepID=UPI001E56EACA
VERLLTLLAQPLHNPFKETQLQHKNVARLVAPGAISKLYPLTLKRPSAKRKTAQKIPGALIGAEFATSYNNY